MLPVPPRLKFHGNVHAAKQFKRFALSQLEILKKQMSFQGLKQGVRRVSPFEGVLIECVSKFGLHVVNVLVASFGKFDKIKNVVSYNKCDEVESKVLVNGLIFMFFRNAFDAKEYSIGLDITSESGLVKVSLNSSSNSFPFDVPNDFQAITQIRQNGENGAIGSLYSITVAPNTEDIQLLSFAVVGEENLSSFPLTPGIAALCLSGNQRLYCQNSSGFAKYLIDDTFNFVPVDLRGVSSDYSRVGTTDYYSLPNLTSFGGRNVISTKRKSNFMTEEGIAYAFEIKLAPEVPPVNYNLGISRVSEGYGNIYTYGHSATERAIPIKIVIDEASYGDCEPTIGSYIDRSGILKGYELTVTRLADEPNMAPKVTISFANESLTNERSQTHKHDLFRKITGEEGLYVSIPYEDTYFGLKYAEHTVKDTNSSYWVPSPPDAFIHITETYDLQVGPSTPGGLDTVNVIASGASMYFKGNYTSSSIVTTTRELYQHYWVQETLASEYIMGDESLQIKFPNESPGYYLSDVALFSKTETFHLEVEDENGNLVISDEIRTSVPSQGGVLYPVKVAPINSVEKSFVAFDRLSSTSFSGVKYTSLEDYWDANSEVIHMGWKIQVSIGTLYDIDITDQIRNLISEEQFLGSLQFMYFLPSEYENITKVKSCKQYELI